MGGPITTSCVPGSAVKLRFAVVIPGVWMTFRSGPLSERGMSEAPTTVLFATLAPVVVQTVSGRLGLSSPKGGRYRIQAEREELESAIHAAKTSETQGFGWVSLVSGWVPWPGRPTGWPARAPAPRHLRKRQCREGSALPGAV